MVSTQTNVEATTVLLIEDNLGDARLIRELLREVENSGPTRLILEHVGRLSDGLARIAEGRIDAVLLDLTLPDSHGIETVMKIYSEATGVPVLVLTGLNDESMGVQALKEGAEDYLVKGHIEGESLARAIRYAISRKLTQGALRQYAETQQRLMLEVMEAQETERHRLSMDLHDGPLQSLGVGLMALDRAIRRYESGDSDRGLQELVGLRGVLHSMVEEIRAVLADLSLEVLTAYGLHSALTDYVTRFTDATNIDVDLNAFVGHRLPANIELLVYRWSQEALANVQKHSGAKHVKVELRVESSKLYLTIADDGQGFDVQQAFQTTIAGRGLGLKSMRQRAHVAGGDLMVISESNKGTTLRFWCPILSRFDE